MNPFQSLRDYELFVYTLQAQFPVLQRSTLVVAQRSRQYAELEGDLTFSDGYRLVVYERLSWERGSLTIEGYSYECWRAGEKCYWYDSQPHPNDPALVSTQPHHKHLPPDIKHHRLPAPGLGFDSPNLPFLIDEVTALLGTIS